MNMGSDAAFLALAAVNTATERSVTACTGIKELLRFAARTKELF
jgi:hypothetical protein